MRISSLRHLIKQGLKNMGTNRLMTFACIGVLTACFIITGIAALLTVNVNRVVDYLSDQNEIHVFLLPEVDDATAAAMEAEILAISNVASTTFISKEQAFLDMESMLDENMLDGFELIFPAKYLVTVEDLNFVQETNQRLMEMPLVEKTEAPVDLAEVMVTIQSAVTWFGWGLVAILAFVSLIIISNTISLTVFARRREISIMKYVGATNAFIRLPFFVEGMTVGIVAGLLSGGIICGGYYLVHSFLMDMTSVWVLGIISRIYSLSEIWLYIVLAAVAAGAFVGGVGTSFNVRKHLKV